MVWLLKSVLGATPSLGVIGLSVPLGGSIRCSDMLNRMYINHEPKERQVKKIRWFLHIWNKFAVPHQQLQSSFQVTPGQFSQPQGRNMSSAFCFKCHGCRHFANACLEAECGLNRKA